MRRLLTLAVALLLTAGVVTDAQSQRYRIRNKGNGGGGGGGCTTTVGATESTVAAAITAASNGDTICVTGSDTWTSTLTISKPITLKASGTVTITDSVATLSNVISVTEQTTGTIRIEGFSFVVGGNIHQNPNGVIVVTGQPSGGRPVLITGNSYAAGTSGDFMIMNTNRGVIWNNTETSHVFGGNCFNNVSFVRQKTSQVGFTWDAPSTAGVLDTTGEKNLYIEHNTLYGTAEGIDVDDEGRAVIRFNTFTNAGGALSHGADTSGIGSRGMEIYGNTFINDQSLITENGCVASPQNVNGYIYHRGGGANYTFNNVIPDPTGLGYWGSKSAMSFTVETLRRNAGSYPCWAGGYPAPRQFGWGYSTGGTQAGTSGVFQDLEPTYVWQNTGSGNYSSPGVFDYAPDECGGGASVATFVQQNREYYLENGSFTGAAGIGIGVRGSRPLTCTVGTAYWSTDQGGNWDTTNGTSNDGTLDKCTATNTWTNAFYTPAVYPHTLRAGS